MAGAATRAPEMAVDSILVYVGLDRVGDGVMKLPFVRALRNAFPDAEVTWLAGQGESVYRTGVGAAGARPHRSGHR